MKKHLLCCYQLYKYDTNNQKQTSSQTAFPEFLTKNGFINFPLDGGSVFFDGIG